jgi:acetoin utilization deacetylase AcuC-like enzyme
MSGHGRPILRIRRQKATLRMEGSPRSALPWRMQVKMPRRRVIGLAAGVAAAPLVLGWRPAPRALFYSADYALAAHSFETTRKAKWIADSFERRPIERLGLVAPRPLTEDEAAAVHDAAYVAAVRTGEPRGLAQSQGFSWDSGLWRMVLASNGGAVAAAREAMRAGIAGSLSSGLHHARRDRGAGFCTFNGLALAARAALAAGAERVLVLDLDAHCGGGTHSLVGTDPRIRHVDVAVNDFDTYAPAPGNSLDRVGEAAEYLPAVERQLERLGAFDLCLYNAGMDPHEDCPVGGLRGITGETLAARERLVFGWARAHRTPIAFVLAGGYLGPQLDVDALVALHRLTLEAAAA